MSKGGLAFLNKKTWHTMSIKHVEIVWAAEEKAKTEQRRLDALKKEKEEERQIEELRKLQAESGLVSKAQAGRLDWMYSAPMVDTSTEEYLTGKEAPALKNDNELKELQNRQNAGSLLLQPKVNDVLEMETRLREDPMMEIMRNEQASRQAVLKNPLKMKKIRENVRTGFTVCPAHLAQAELIRKLKKASKKALKKAKKAERKAATRGSDEDESSDESEGASRSRDPSPIGERESQPRSYPGNKYGLLHPSHVSTSPAVSTGLASPGRSVSDHVKREPRRSRSGSPSHKSRKSHRSRSRSPPRKSGSARSRSPNVSSRRSRSRSRSPPRSSHRPSSSTSKRHASCSPSPRSSTKHRRSRSRTPPSSSRRNRSSSPRPSKSSSASTSRRSRSRSPDSRSSAKRDDRHRSSRSRSNSPRSAPLKKEERDPSPTAVSSSTFGRRPTKVGIVRKPAPVVIAPVSEEERQRKLREMMSDAQSHDEQKVRRALSSQAQTKLEEEQLKQRDSEEPADFISTLNKAVYSGNETLEERTSKYKAHRQKGNTELHRFL